MSFNKIKYPRKEFPFLSLKKQYESMETIQKMEEIRQQLMKDGQDSTITNKYLASLALDLIVFQEKMFGIEVKKIILFLFNFIF